MAKILNIGSLNLDYVYAVPHFVAAGETLLSSRRDVFAGGKGLNQTVAAARAGAEVCHGGAVGADGDMFWTSFGTPGRTCPPWPGWTCPRVTPSSRCRPRGRTPSSFWAGPTGP